MGTIGSQKMLSNYLPLYLKCDVLVYEDDSFEKFGYDKLLGVSGIWAILSTAQVSMRLIKPILRPLSSMTEEEFAVLLQRMDGADFEFNDLHYFNNQSSKFSPDAFLYLVSKGFDLFGLIEAGLAISSLNTKSNDK